MFRRKQRIRPASGQRFVLVDRTDAPNVARDNDKTLVPVLTRAEVLATVDLLEEYIDLSSDEQSSELAGTMIVRLLDRLHRVDGPDVPGSSGREMASRKSRAWQGVVVGSVMIVAGVVLLAKHIPVLGVSALPIVGAGTVPLLLGAYQLLTAREGPRRK